MRKKNIANREQHVYRSLVGMCLVYFRRPARLEKSERQKKQQEMS